MAAGEMHAPAADGDCLDCHRSHHSEEPSLLAAAMPDQCLACHDGDDEDFKGRHLGLAGAKLDCRKCHDPHVAESGGLMQRNQHDPFEGDACDVCHPGGRS